MSNDIILTVALFGGNLWVSGCVLSLAHTCTYSLSPLCIWVGDFGGVGGFRS